MKARALIIDDEPDIRELITMTLEGMDIDCVDAEDVATAKAQLNQNVFNLCLTDMRLPDGDGIEIVEYIQQTQPNLPVAVITAYGNMELAITALKAGAFDFVSKPVNLRMLRNLVNTAIKLSKPDPARAPKHQLLGQSQALENLRQMIVKVSRSQAPVMITGDSGTGKELVARLIHEHSPRADGPFVPVNCGAIPSELMESEFFGHMKGSFTGAVADKTGLFLAAQGGTLFLDEIADLPLSMQVKLLRVIQEKAVRPVGSNSETPIDVRILSATHKNIQVLTDAAEFRQDLLYRINVIPLHVPALRERPEDIAVLVDFILANLREQMQLPALGIHAEALQALLKYSFPGNVRELENILERAATLCEQDNITTKDLFLPSPAEPTASMESNIPLDDYLGNIEREELQKLLEKNRWNKTKTAKELGMTLRMLRYRLKKVGLD